LMKELFNTRVPGGEKPDIQLCIFPHLKEFLAIDMRDGTQRIQLLNAAEVFTEDFFSSVEEELSDIVHDETEFPFAHIINLSLRLEEAVRGTAMTFILNQMGVTPDTEPAPSVIVLIISGGALGAQPELVLDGLKRLIANRCGEEPVVREWDAVLSRLIAEEHAILKDLNQHELTEALVDDSPDYFMLWENRN
jgi:hypothetical protein